ncbi:MAG: nuclear transport factor 2 family protein [Cyanobacteria bacterium J06607_13]
MTHRRHWLHPQKLLTKLKGQSLASVALLGLALGLGSEAVNTRLAQAASPDTAPAALTTAINQIETAASAGDLSAVMESYSPTFTNEDGFTYETLETALQDLWERYDSLTYRVELQSWEPVAGGFMAETVTYINGTKTLNGQATTLESVIRSEQTFEAGKIVSQTTLSERNQVTSGEQPPTVSVILAEQVEAGETYDFDAIVVEPLGNRYLLGAAVEEGTTATDFFTGRPVELELLSAGGLFKIGEAPSSPDSRWVSALLVREDGLTVVTRRLQVN